MLTQVARFELRYQLRSPLFVVSAILFFLLPFAATTNDQIQIGAKGNGNVNSPYAILNTLGIMSVLGVFVLAAFVANVVIRDDESGFSPLLRTTRITKRDYLLGRFLGACAVVFLVMTAVPVGMIAGSFMPWLDAEKVGAFALEPYLFGLGVLVLPAVLFMGAALFALATLTRSMMGTYVGVLAFLVLYGASRVLMADPFHDNLSALSDPFGLGPFFLVTRYWTAADRNALLPPLSGVLLYNRILWLSLGAAFFAAAFVRFRFETKGGRSRAPSKREPSGDDLPPPARPLSAPGVRVGWQQLAALARFDTRFVLRSPAFLVLLALGVLNALVSLSTTIERRGTPYLPVTRAVVGALEGAFALFPMIIAIYYAGELVWRDRERRVHEIVDATPAPDWAFVVPKVLTIAVVLLCAFCVAVVTGVSFQLAHGYAHLEIVSYLVWFLLPHFITATLLGALAVFLQALSPHKFVGWGLMFLYVLGTLVLPSLGLGHDLYNYAGVPGVPLSDMNGMGRFWVGRAWFEVYWLAFALALLVLAHLLWRRGTEARFRPRLARLRSRLRGAPGATLLSAMLVWVGVGAFAFYNTNVLNEYRTKLDDDRRLADYEKALIGYDGVPQPRIVDVNLSVDLYPRDTRAVTVGTYVIENRTGAPIPSLHVRWQSALKLTALDVPGARVEKDHGDFHYRIYSFEAPMQPGERRTITFRTVLEERGFPDVSPLTRIVENGIFLENAYITPSLGLDRRGLMKDRAKRRKYGLPGDLPVAKLEDESANAFQYLRHDSDWVTAELRISTDADQTPVAPGYQVSDVTRDGRRTLTTRTEAPILNFFSIQSARYAVKKDSWTGKNGQPVELSVYYHPPHDHDVRRMLDAMRASLDVFSSAFSPYQFRQARILEFPGYESFAQSFANTVPWSESVGFVQDFHDDKADESLDLVTYGTAHELGHQWWAHQIIGADKQGMTLLSESFAQYSALLVMERLYGKEQIRKFLKKELDLYLQSRGAETVLEQPLARVEDQPYVHYHKGSLAMYWLKEVVGEEVVNRALQGLLREFAFKAAPYPSATDFLRLLRAEAGPSHDQLITDLFEKITLYDMKASGAVAKRLPDGRYEVTFTVSGKKLYADGKGKETEAPLDEPFDVGAFTVEPGKKGYRRESVLGIERRSLESGDQTVTLVVPRAPKLVGVDPYNERIDRNSNDNFAVVTGE
jgi:ABC-2 type transport system permease protein